MKKQIKELVKRILPAAVCENEQVAEAWTNEILRVIEEERPAEEEIIQPGEVAAVKWLLLKGMETTAIKGRFEIFARLHEKLLKNVKEK